MKKLLILLLTALCACALFSFGCKADNESGGDDKNGTNTQQENEECPDDECPDTHDGKIMPQPELLPHMPHKRNNDKPMLPHPLPIPSPHRTK